jgi:diacylglycerol O-acyltransferase / wax synthase
VSVPEVVDAAIARTETVNPALNGLAYDRAAVQHKKLFAECMLAGFNEILAFSGEPKPHAVPASFAVRVPSSPSRLVMPDDRLRGTPAGRS